MKINYDNQDETPALGHKRVRDHRDGDEHRGHEQLQSIPNSLYSSTEHLND